MGGPDGLGVVVPSRSGSYSSRDLFEDQCQVRLYHKVLGGTRGMATLDGYEVWEVPVALVTL